MRIVWIFSFMFGVCVEWCDMFVERLSIWVVAFSFLLYCSMSFSLLFYIIGNSPAWFASKKNWQIQVHYVKVPAGTN